MRLTVKQLAYTREKRKYQTSPATRLKVNMKRKREKSQDQARAQARKLKNSTKVPLTILARLEKIGRRG